MSWVSSRVVLVPCVAVRHRYRGALVRFAQPYRTVKVYGQRVVPVIITKLTATGVYQVTPPLAVLTRLYVPAYEEHAHDTAACTVAMELWQPDSSLKTAAQVRACVCGVGGDGAVAAAVLPCCLPHPHTTMRSR